MLRPIARLFLSVGGGGGANWSKFGTIYDYAWIMIALDLANIFFWGGGPPFPPTSATGLNAYNS